MKKYRYIQLYIVRVYLNYHNLVCIYEIVAYKFNAKTKNKTM